MPNTDWKSKYGGWALITGASSGLGEEFARSLARRGMDVILVARREDRLRELADEITAEHGVEAHVVPLDLAAADMLPRLRDAVGDRPVGVLVNNAGFGGATSFQLQPPEKVAAMVDLNCRTPAVLMREYIGPMIERKRGALIMLASVVAFESFPFLSLYSATKAFDLTLGEAVALELEGSGVESLVVAPGATRTEFADVAGTRHSGAMATPESVVEGALGVLGRRRTYVPGAGNKFVVVLMRKLLPRWVVARILSRKVRTMVPPESYADLRR